MRYWGITGTNGKTTTTWIAAEFINADPARRCGYVTTVEVNTGTRQFYTGYTTPPLAQLKEIFAEMERNGCTDCVMEVSSHAIHQHRTGDTVFSGGGFTNLSEDHLDYHKTMEAYFDVKLDFARQIAKKPTKPSDGRRDFPPYVVCLDGGYGREMFNACGAYAVNVLPVSRRTPRFDLTGLQLVGDYNESNVLVAAELAEHAGISHERIQAVIPTLKPRWGRLERVENAAVRAAVYVDFAHTPDGLEKVLTAARGFTKGRLWVVFGAGGDRDPMKRPLMGEACARLADRLVVTSDNPRSEDPLKIIDAIKEGIDHCPPQTYIEPDRKKAIEFALREAAADDVVIIAGKGHETTQEIAGVKHPFDDRVIARSYSLVKSLCCFLFSVLLGAEAFGATGETFLPSGKMTLGANYWASHAATQMWRRWDAQIVEQDLKTLAENGFTLLRVFPNWADFQPIHACFLSADKCDVVYDTRMFESEEPLPDTPCGRAGVDERMVEHFEEFCDIAERHGIKLIVSLLTGQMTFRTLIPPALANRDHFSDPYSLMWQGRYVECLVNRLKGKKAIAAWESGNESRILAKCPTSSTAEFWQRYIHQAIRQADPSRPVIGVDGLCISREQPWPSSVNAKLSDYVTVHPYAFWDAQYNDDFNSVRSLTYAAAINAALEQIGGRPSFIEEHGSRRQEQTSQGNLARYMRAMLWNSWAADAKAMLWWCAYDQTGLTIPPYDWRQPCVELGIFRRDRTPYPAVTSVRNFVAFQRRLPFEGLPKAKPDAVVLTVDSEVVHSSYVLARQAGIFPQFVNPEEKLPDANCYFVPSATGRAFFTIRRWEELKAKVRAGATLYLSWDDTFLDSLEEVAGIEVDFREKSRGVDHCDFGAFKVDIGYGVKRRFNALSAETLARNQSGEGVFFRNRYGKGTVYTLIHNVEKSFYASAGKYAGDACRIWATVYPVKRLVTTAEKDVFVSEHPFDADRCAVVVVNNADRDFVGHPAIAAGWKVASALTDDASAAKWEDGLLTLVGNAGILLELVHD